MQKQYDIVEGGVANDNVIDTVEDYENGIITAEQALGQCAIRRSIIRSAYSIKKS